MNRTLNPERPQRGLHLLWGLFLCLGIGGFSVQARAQVALERSPSAAVDAPAPTQGKTSGGHAETQSDGPGTQAGPALMLSADGVYALDPQNKLAWLRCVEGMTWNGHNCVGEARLMTHTTAQALATARAKADGVAWRLPRIHELRRLKEDAASATLFPADPRNWTWSGNASINVSQSNPYNYGNIASGSTNQEERLSARMGWAVHLGSGESRGDVSRSTALVVRLVRPYQP